ncbi:MAG: uroporphyrinogen decarboxylase family protein [Candidatus Hodarchaeota archaeon]
MNKRELVLKTLQHEETDICPIFYLGMERSETCYQAFAESDEADELFTMVPGVGDITLDRFFNVDLRGSQPFQPTRTPLVEQVLDDPELNLNYWGCITKRVKRASTGLPYNWHVEGYFREKETVLEHWDKYGKPSEKLNPDEDFSRKKWEDHVEALSPYFYPMGSYAISMFTHISDAMGFDRLAYYMRKDPAFIQQIFDEYAKLNVEVLKALADAGVDIFFYGDDLGQKDRGLLSLKNFRKFVIPAYKKLFGAAKKRGVFVIQHSCGNVTEYIPDLIDTGLDGLQSLEPASGIDLAQINDDFGDKLALLGGVDSSVVCTFGTPKDVEEDVKKCLKAATPGGGYFVGPAHDILSVPWENMLALRAAIEKYRKLPINF